MLIQIAHHLGMGEDDMTVINGYEISKVECSSQWGALKIGTTGGMLFRTKRAAMAWAAAQMEG